MWFGLMRPSKLTDSTALGHMRAGCGFGAIYYPCPACDQIGLRTRQLLGFAIQVFQSTLLPQQWDCCRIGKESNCSFHYFIMTEFSHNILMPHCSDVLQRCESIHNAISVDSVGLIILFIQQLAVLLNFGFHPWLRTSRLWQEVESNSFGVCTRQGLRYQPLLDVRQLICSGELANVIVQLGHAFVQTSPGRGQIIISMLDPCAGCSILRVKSTAAHCPIEKQSRSP